MADLVREVDELLKCISGERLTLGDVMKRLERLHFTDTIAINLQAKLIGKIANSPRFIPINCLDAEQRVNSLLEYFPSLSYPVCSLACSLIKPFCTCLDSKGQHITTQVTICCKNLLTIITKTKQDPDQGLSLCQSVALASLCYITTNWSSKLQVQSEWLPFALLTLNTVLGVLIDHKMHYFVHQVASEGLRRVLNIPYFWSSLTSTEQNKVISHLKQLFDIHLGREMPDPFILIKLLHSAANEDLVWSTVFTKKHIKDFLNISWKCLPQIDPDVDMKMPLDLRWLALKLLWSLLNVIKKHHTSQGSSLTVNLDKFKPHFANGCCRMDTTRTLKKEICTLIAELHL